LIRASFVPNPVIQDLRSLMRARKQLGREQASHVQRRQKTLEEANIKLDSVITDIVGVRWTPPVRQSGWRVKRESRGIIAPCRCWPPM